MAGFVEVAREVFRFLESEYGYTVLKTEDNSSGGYVTYINRDAGVGLKVLYELSSAFIFVFVYRLVVGGLRDNALPITGDSQINCFDFNDYLPPDSKMRPAYDYGEDSNYYDPQNGIRNYTEEFAARLRMHGKHILKGDLSMLPAMESIIKRRAQGLAEGKGKRR